MEYDNEKSGALFKNNRKEKDTHPEYKGSCQIEGKELWISAWLKKSRTGETFMSLAFQPKEEQVKPEPSEDLGDAPF